MKVVLHPDARHELRTAAVWYEERRSGLGDEFVEQITSLLGSIAQAPHSFPLWPGIDRHPRPMRRALLQRFPYAVAFELHSDHVLILAIAHSKRRPLYWIARRGGQSY